MRSSSASGATGTAKLAGSAPMVSTTTWWTSGARSVDSAANERARASLTARPAASSRSASAIGLELRLSTVVADGDTVASGELRQPAGRSEDGALGGSPGVVLGVCRLKLDAAGELDRTGQGQGDQVGVEVDGLPLQLGGGQPVGERRPPQVVEHRGEPAVGKPPELVGLAGDERELFDEVVGIRPVAHESGCQFGELGRNVLGQRLDGQGPVGQEQALQLADRRFVRLSRLVLVCGLVDAVCHTTTVAGRLVGGGSRLGDT